MTRVGSQLVHRNEGAQSPNHPCKQEGEATNIIPLTLYKKLTKALGSAKMTKRTNHATATITFLHVGQHVSQQAGRGQNASARINPTHKSLSLSIYFPLPPSLPPELTCTSLWLPQGLVHAAV